MWSNEDGISQWRSWSASNAPLVSLKEAADLVALGQGEEESGGVPEWFP